MDKQMTWTKERMEAKGLGQRSKLDGLMDGGGGEYEDREKGDEILNQTDM